MHLSSPNRQLDHVARGGHIRERDEPAWLAPTLDAWRRDVGAIVVLAAILLVWARASLTPVRNVLFERHAERRGLHRGTC